jgi:putative flavoprotein involved in K+ transport
VTVDGEVLEPQTIVWCTGFRSNYGWIDLPVTDAKGHPITERGVSQQAGLYFLGVDFQYAVASGFIQGLDQDARYLQRAMAKEPGTPRLRVTERAAA